MEPREGNCHFYVTQPQILSWGMFIPAMLCRNAAEPGTNYCSTHPKGAILNIHDDTEPTIRLQSERKSHIGRLMGAVCRFWKWRVRTHTTHEI
jgi:hypothetical protein